MRRPECRYQRELYEIEYILRNMEIGRIYGINGNASQSDGSLSHNANKLREQIYDLVNKYEKDLPSDSEVLGEALYGIKKHNT